MFLSCPIEKKEAKSLLLLRLKMVHIRTQQKGCEEQKKSNVGQLSQVETN